MPFRGMMVWQTSIRLTIPVISLLIQLILGHKKILGAVNALENACIYVYTDVQSYILAFNIVKLNKN